ncbi:DnaJ-domain-containing protein [Hesseltinella vesiculosa]|uniref:DnaJ-domain-containing protein n=1 Tax=Hesseltinella vesiculosa TaxID=101127 RepID=A0A1X2GAY9_9FUNG|nr:DnaJ-domain-containing protein [Hesseltinella vesiculosa]
MEVNKDEALRCISIAEKHFSNLNIDAALKFAKKSMSLYPTDQAESLLQRIQTSSQKQPSSTPSPSPSSGLRNRSTVNPPTPPEKKYTTEQVTAVKTILSCGHDYYKILSLEKSCTDAHIKKSYRKLALQFHPDKNSAPGADEAFKLISKAFTVLSDPQKRAIHDASGGDPDNRATNSRPSSTHYYHQHQFGGNDVNAEDLFDMFFGGGTRVRFRRQHPFHQARQHPFAQQQQQHGRQEALGFVQIIPVLLLVLYAVLAGFMATEPSPAYTFTPSSIYTQGRTTPQHNVLYYVNPEQLNQRMQKSDHALRRIEQQVEQEYLDNLMQRCQWERRQRAFQLQQARGSIFGIGRDEQRYQQVLQMATPYCDEMQTSWGVQPNQFY